MRVGDAIYIRSANGPRNGWFRRAVRSGLGHIESGGVEKDVVFTRAEPEVGDEVTAAYHDKYDRDGPGPGRCGDRARRTRHDAARDPRGLRPTQTDSDRLRPAEAD